MIRAFTTILLLCLAATFTLSAVGAPAHERDYSSFEDTKDSIKDYSHGALDLLDRVLSKSSDIVKYAMIEWKVAAVTTIVWMIFAWGLGAASIFDVIKILFVVLISKAIMDNFSLFTRHFWYWSQAIAGTLQKTAVGNDGLMWISHYIWNVANGISFGSPSVFAPLQILYIGLLTITVFLLVIISTFINAWALWGYVVMAMVGLFFVPFLIFAPLASIFDGWLSMFFYFLIYNIIGRANLIVTVMVLHSAFGYGTRALPGDVIQVFTIQSISDVIGLVCLLFMSILGLFMTGSLAAGIARSAPITVGGAVHKAASSASNAVGAFL